VALELVRNDREGKGDRVAWAQDPARTQEQQERNRQDERQDMVRRQTASRRHRVSRPLPPPAPASRLHETLFYYEPEVCHQEIGGAPAFSWHREHSSLEGKTGIRFSP